MAAADLKVFESNRSTKKVTVVNGHSSLNKGDAALMDAAMRVARALTATKLTLVCDTPERECLRYVDAKVMGSAVPWRNIFGFRRLIRKFAFYPYMFALHFVKSSHVKIFLPSALRELLAELEESDIVISCGGGYFNPYGKIFYRLFLLNYASRCGADVYILPMSVEDYQNLDPIRKKYLEITFKACTRVFSRENITSKLLSDLGVNYENRCDMAFVAPKLDAYQVNSKFICLTAINWSFPGESPEKRALYVEFLAGVANFVIDEFDLEVIVIPQVIGPGVNDDRNIWHEIRARVNDTRLTFLDEDLPVEEIRRIIGRARFMIGSRMHSNIFALSATVPVFAISYLPKTRGIMQDFELADFVMNINDLSIESARILLRRLNQEREDISEKIYERVKELHYLDIEADLS